MEQLFILIKIVLVKEIIIFITAAVLVSFFVRKLISISHSKHLFDEPLEARKIHKTKTPTLGGVAMAGSMVLTTCLFINTVSIPAFSCIFFSFLILFLTGISDDLIGISAIKKLIVQIIASSVVAFAGYRFTSFCGFFGWSEMHYWTSLSVSVFFITFVVNAFNLIDGINCLAGSIGCLASAFFACYFWQMNDAVFASFAIALCGCLAGFLWFNKTPAKIFMGDTGSMFIGFLMSLFSIHLLELSRQQSVVSASQTTNLVAALLIIPVYDTVRVFVLRIAHSQSPFTADRNHIHHRIIDLGLSHLQATGLLVSLDLLFILIALAVQPLQPELFVFAVFIVLTAFNSILSVLRTRKRKQLLRKSKVQEQEPEIRIISKKRFINV